MPHRPYTATDWSAELPWWANVALDQSYFRSHPGDPVFEFHGTEETTSIPAYNSNAVIPTGEHQHEDREPQWVLPFPPSVLEDLSTKVELTDRPGLVYHNSTESEDTISTQSVLGLRSALQAPETQGQSIILRNNISPPVQLKQARRKRSCQTPVTRATKKRLPILQREDSSSTIEDLRMEEAEADIIHSLSTEQTEPGADKTGAATAHARVEQRYRAGIKVRFDDLLNVLVQASGHHKLSAASRKVDILDHAIQYIEQAEREKQSIVRETDLKERIRVLEKGTGSRPVTVARAYTVLPNTPQYG